MMCVSHSIIPFILSVIFILLLKLGTGFCAENSTIKTSPVNVTGTQGSSVVLECEIQNLGSATVSWHFLEHTVQITSGESILSNADGHFSLIRPEDSSNSHWNLQISFITTFDQGHYQCKVDGTSQTVTHRLIVVGAPDEPPTNTKFPNVTDCCVEKNMSASCLPACDPGSLDVNSFQSLTACGGTNDLQLLVECATDGRNHVGCCKRRMLPDLCLDLCMNNPPPMPLGNEYLPCLFRATDILQCTEEGQGLLPSPPVRVYVLPMLWFQLVISWQPPLENRDLVIGYRVMYRPISSNITLSTEIIPATTQSYILKNLEHDTPYIVYMIALSAHGSSLPSAWVEIATWAGLPSADRNTTIIECCQKMQVTSDCMSSLCTTDSLKQLSPDNILKCYGEQEKVFLCLTGSRNNTRCCQQHNVPDHCLGMCSGKLPQLDWSLSQCILRLPIIEACTMEGIRTLPAPPRNLQLTAVTADSAVLSWTPAEGAQSVMRYVVAYRKYNYPDKEYDKELVTGYSTTLPGLKPDTKYEVLVAAANENGTSLPIGPIIFLTYEPASITQPSTTETPVPELFYNETACCIQKGMKTQCLPFCDYTADPAIYDDVGLTFTCINELSALLECGTDGRNHEPCCKERGLTSPCSDLCSYTGSGLSNDHLACITNIQDITMCLKEGIVALPRPPEQLTIVNYTAHTITLSWIPPVRGPTVDYYLVRYKQFSDPWTQLNTTKLTYILQNLVPDTRYTMQVLSVNTNGTSTPGSTVRWTPYIAPPEVPGTNVSRTNWTAWWQNRTHCCQQNIISDSTCQQYCESGSFPNPLVCSMEIDKVVACNADGRNHTECCQTNDVPDLCLLYCQGQTPNRDGLSALCLTYIPIIFSCFAAGKDILPLPPAEFRELVVLPRSILVGWKTPTDNCMEGCSYTMIYWKKQSTSISQSLIMNVTSPYNLTDLQPLTEYVMTVIAQNSYGSSLPAPPVIVTTRPTNFIDMMLVQAPDGVISRDSDVRLICDAYGSVVQRLEWSFNTRILSVSSQLFLYSVQPKDEGVYTCSVKDSLNVSHQETIFVKIKYKPVLVRVEDDTKAPIPSETAFLTCEFRGFPDFIDWLKNGQPLTSDLRYRNTIGRILSTGRTVSQLKIYSVRSTDFATYTCKGSNEFGSATGQVMLKNAYEIPPPPTGTVPPKAPNVTACCVQAGVSSMCMDICSFDVDILLLSTDPSKATCLAYLEAYVRCASDGINHSPCCVKKGIPDFCLPMCYGEFPILSSDRLMTCILNAQTMLDCVEQGHDLLPSPPQNVTAELKDGAVLIEWQAPAYNPDKVGHYQVHSTSSVNAQDNFRTLSKSHFQYSYSGLSARVNYTFWVIAVNDFGTSNKSEMQTVNIEGICPSAPTDLTADLVNGVNIRLAWNPPSNAYVDDYIVFYKLWGYNTKYTQVATKSVTLRLESLLPDEKYEMYVIARNAYGSCGRSETEHVVTTTVPLHPTQQPKTEGPSASVTALAVALTLVLVLIAGFSVGTFICLRKRRKPASAEAVSFENPSYGRNQVRISGLPDSTMQPDQQFGYAPLQEELDSSQNMEINSNATPVDKDAAATLHLEQNDKNSSQS